MYGEDYILKQKISVYLLLFEDFQVQQHLYFLFDIIVELSGTLLLI